MLKVYLLLLLLVCQPCLAETATDTFPQELNQSNVKLTFEVDSTWHLIEGQAKVVQGKVWLSDQSNINSIKAKIDFPTKNLDTGNSMRDSKMKEVMAAEEFPNVRFTIESVGENCPLDQLESRKQCRASISGALTIKNTSKQLAMPVFIVEQANRYIVSGKTSFKWSEFGVEDPSIIVAKLDETVVVSFTCELKKMIKESQ